MLIIKTVYGDKYPMEFKGFLKSSNTNKTKSLESWK